MKFIHISDLHIGKTLHQENLLEIQIDALNQVLEHCKKEEIKLLVIAGDVYDRSVPSSEAVEVLNNFLQKAIADYGLQILMITGNHDSSERMSFLSNVLVNSGLHIVSYPDAVIKPIIIEDIHFYLVPFFKPSKIQMLYDIPCNTYNEAFKVYLEHQEIDYSKTNVLITHQFIAGNTEVIQSESEVTLTVGGTEIIGVDLVKDFDYVALGHIHACQKIGYDHVRYSGSLLKYSFDEVNQTKGMLEVSLENKQCSIKRIEINPLQDVCKYTGLFEDFLNKDIVTNCNDYLLFILDDENTIPFAMDRLKKRYPKLLALQYTSIINHKSKKLTVANKGFEQKNQLELFREFYFKMKNTELSDERSHIIEKIIEGEQ